MQNAEEIFVRVGTNENAIEKAEIVSINSDLDLAVILLDGAGYYAATLDLGETVQLGEDVVVLGYPFGAKMADDVSKMSVSFTRGYVSSWQVKNGKKRILLDVSAKAGNSGSPVVCINTGKVVGILSGSVLGGVNNREEVNYMIPLLLLNEMLSD